MSREITEHLSFIYQLLITSKDIVRLINVNNYCTGLGEGGCSASLGGGYCSGVGVYVPSIMLICALLKVVLRIIKTVNIALAV